MKLFVLFAACPPPCQFDEEDRKVAKAVLESLILKHNAKRAFADQLQIKNGQEKAAK